VFTRVFINNDSAEAYFHLFRAWFRILHDEFGILDRWRHMDGEKDMTAGKWRSWTKTPSSWQVCKVPKNSRLWILLIKIGLGRYLVSRYQVTDQPDRSWQWHLMNTVILCRVHFDRGIQRTGVPKGSLLWTNMHALKDCEDMQTYNVIIDLIKGKYGNTATLFYRISSQSL
jgi:hypothetical protein